MAEIDEWRRYAKMLNFPLPEQAEKDYLQDLVLRNIYSVLGSELLFRGGTAISKICASGRFSEDLDFLVDKRCTEKGTALVPRLERGLADVNNYFKVEYARDDYKDMINYTLKIDGPLYKASGNVSARQRISMNINTYERNLLDYRTVLRETPYPNLPPYTLPTESIEELLADKIKAALERRHKRKVVFARDIYDIWSLVTKYALRFKPSLVKKKMELYGIVKFSVSGFESCVKEAEKYWEDEMGTVIISVPKYDKVRKSLELFIADGGKQ